MTVLVDFGIRTICVCLRVIYFFMKIMPVRNKIVFISRLTNSPSLDFVLLQAELEKNLPDYQYVMKCQKFDDNLGSLLGHAPMMLSQMFHIATSKLVILDSYCIPISVLNHRKELNVVQIWHALGLMKKAGYAALGAEEGWSERRAKAVSMHRGYTHILVSSPACEPAMRQVYGYTDEFPPKHRALFKEAIIGALPRADYLQDKERRSKVCAKIHEAYPFLKEKEIVLYAPTLRKDGKELLVKTKELVEAVKEANAQDNKYVLVVKMHPRHDMQKDLFDSLDDDQSLKTADQSDDVLFDKKFSATEIGMAAHACISDYSSLVYELMTMKKPVYFYAFDLEAYEKSRGIFIDYHNEVPNAVYKNARDLIDAIVCGRHNIQEQQTFCAKYVTLSEGRNTEALAQKIVRIVEGLSPKE
ncbi:MAG: CDP-glycerol glycerophosphotransferase family protein [Coriobacteriia bacterium]|nr:CDP-glycerol glycerophosphotransferase family protein [Coriobacteriia bacterium]